MIGDTGQTFDLFDFAEKERPLPVYLTLLFHAANRGDIIAFEAIINEFAPAIQKIRNEILGKFRVDDKFSEIALYNTAIKTLDDFKSRHFETGFCKFMIIAFRENMNYYILTS